MAWHIFRKDLRLLWPLAALIAAIHVSAAALWVWLGRFLEPRQFAGFAQGLPLLSFLGIVVLTVTLFHQDVVPGDRQDWLVRPIRRRDLVAGKLLFVLLIVIGPLLVADLGEALADGFAPAAALGAAGWRSAWVLCLLALPAIAIGTVTRNLTPALALVFAVLLGWMAFQFLVPGVLGYHTSLGGTGAGWMISAVWVMLTIGAAAVVIGLQYARRSTAVSVAVICIAAACGEISLFLPWSQVFAAQESLSSDAGAATPIGVAFNPSSGPYRAPPGSPLLNLPQGARSRFTETTAAAPVALLLPLRVTGLMPGAVLFLDRANIRISGADGRQLYAGRASLTVDGAASIADAQLTINQPESQTAPADTYEQIFIPPSQFARFGERPVNLTVEYSLSLLRPATVTKLPALGGDARLRGVGWCATRLDSDGDAVELGCIATASRPSCIAASLEDDSGLRRNPRLRHCDPDYAPMSKDDWYVALDQFGIELPFFDRSGLAHYPVDGPMLPHARVVITNYRAVAHFSQRIAVNGIMLRDWRVQ